MADSRSDLAILLQPAKKLPSYLVKNELFAAPRQWGTVCRCWSKLKILFFSGISGNSFGISSLRGLAVFFSEGVCMEMKGGRVVSLCI